MKINLKKLLGMTLVLATSSSFAEQWSALPVNNYSPEPMGDQGYASAEQQLVPKQITEAELTKSLSIEYSGQKGKFSNDIDADLNGFAIGLSSAPTHNGLWTKVEYQKNSDYDADYYEMSFGGQYNFINANRFYLTGTYGIGIGLATASDFDNSTFITLPIGLEGGYSITPNFSIFTGIGYKWAWDVSSSTTCNDGTSSSSSGSGTCSWHGGINHYNSTIGDFDGITYKAGVRYNF